MAKNFLDQEIDPPKSASRFMDGFKFGLGFFVACVLGGSVLALAAVLILNFTTKG